MSTSVVVPFCQRPELVPGACGLFKDQFDRDVAWIAGMEPDLELSGGLDDEFAREFWDAITSLRRERIAQAGLIRPEDMCGSCVLRSIACTGNAETQKDPE